MFIKGNADGRIFPVKYKSYIISDVYIFWSIIMFDDRITKLLLLPSSWYSNTGGIIMEFYYKRGQRGDPWLYTRRDPSPLRIQILSIRQGDGELISIPLYQTSWHVPLDKQQCLKSLSNRQCTVAAIMIIKHHLSPLTPSNKASKHLVLLGYFTVWIMNSSINTSVNIQI